MLITHKCPKCLTGDILYPKFFCSRCDYNEDDITFWKEMKNESYLNQLEQQIAESYPFKTMDIIDCEINLLICYCMNNKKSESKYCLNSLVKNIKKLQIQWNICYSNFAIADEIIFEFEKIKNNASTKQEKTNISTETIDYTKKTLKKFKHQCKQIFNN